MSELMGKGFVERSFDESVIDDIQLMKEVGIVSMKEWVEIQEASSATDKDSSLEEYLKAMWGAYERYEDLIAIRFQEMKESENKMAGYGLLSR